MNGRKSEKYEEYPYETDAFAENATKSPSQSIPYRRIAQACWRELNRVHPELAADMRVDLDDYDLARA